MSKEQKARWSTERILAVVFGFLFVVTLLASVGSFLYVDYKHETQIDAVRRADRAYYGRLTTQSNGKTTDSSLFELANGNKIELDIRDFNIVTYSPYQKTLGTINSAGWNDDISKYFHKTTNENIVGIHNMGEWNFEMAFIDPEKEKMIKFEDSAYEQSDTVFFGEKEFSISTNVPKDDCVSVNEDVSAHYDGYEVFEGWVTECNKTGKVFVSQLTVNDKVALSVSPIELSRLPGGPEAPMSYEPSIYVEFLGVNPDLSNAYFTVMGKTFSIDQDGQVEETKLPDDLVELVWE